MDNSYYDDKIRAIDAKVEAQKIAFSPLLFQTVIAMKELGILQNISESGDNGISVIEMSERLSVPEYGIKVLVEFALGAGIIKLLPHIQEERYVLGKIGWFLLEDKMTEVNMNFVNDICYQGAFHLAESIRTGRPAGLAAFGKWTTIYEALSTLSEKAKKSWFDFDHFYSDIAFPEALPLVFANRPGCILDIGGNTAKWSIACCRYDRNVRMMILDLPGQTAVAEKNAEAAGLSQRISTCSGNILDENTMIPDCADAVWMSQFLDCFSLRQITKIIRKIAKSVRNDTDIYVLEPLWDFQKFPAASYSLQATSIYFTCIANGNSKMYRYGEILQAIEAGGVRLRTAHHDLGSNSYSLLCFRKEDP